jgi:hypothetical protein
MYGTQNSETGLSGLQGYILARHTLGSARLGPGKTLQALRYMLQAARYKLHPILNANF